MFLSAHCPTDGTAQSAGCQGEPDPSGRASAESGEGRKGTAPGGKGIARAPEPRRARHCGGQEGSGNRLAAGRSAGRYFCHRSER